MLKLPLLVLVLVLVLGCVEVCCGASVKHNDTAVAEWLRQCPDPSSPCCRIWHRAVLKSEQARQSFLSSVLDPKLAAFDAFDRYEPTWGCEAIERVPSMGGDGPKWLCGAEVTRNHALVYSFGSNGDTQFEEGVRVLFPSSEIFIFDPTMSTDGVAEVKRRGFNLIESGLVPRGDTSFVHAKVAKYYRMLKHLMVLQLVPPVQQSMAGRDLMQHMRALEHAGRTIDILKMDIDAMEYAALNNIKIGICYLMSLFNTIVHTLIEHSLVGQESVPMVTCGWGNY